MRILSKLKLLQCTGNCAIEQVRFELFGLCKTKSAETNYKSSNPAHPCLLKMIFTWRSYRDGFRTLYQRWSVSWSTGLSFGNVGIRTSGEAVVDRRCVRSGRLQGRGGRVGAKGWGCLSRWVRQLSMGAPPGFHSAAVFEATIRDVGVRPV